MKAFRSSSFLVLFFCMAAGCQKQLNWYFTATGTLKDPQGICLNNAVYGTFYNGVKPGQDTAYIELMVNVFTTGSYSISTEVQNGVSFADSGFFNSTGLHTIKLRPAGIPVAPLLSTFTICFDTSCCPITLNVKDSASSEIFGDNAWRYKDINNGEIYQGAINATHVLLTPSSILLSLRKEITQQNDTSFEINIVFPGNKIIPGSFTTDTLNAMALSARGVCINCAWQVAYKFYGALSTIVVTSYDPETKAIKGTFSGTTIDGQNNVVPIDKGIFKAIVK